MPGPSNPTTPKKPDDSYPGLGPRALRPLANPEVDLAHLKLTPVDGFVLSRVDGLTSYREICMVTGLVPSETVAILQRLKNEGLIFNPGESVTRAEPAAAAPAPEPAAYQTKKTYPMGVPITGARPTPSTDRQRHASPPDGPSLLERLDDKSRIDPADLLGAPDLSDELKTRLLRLSRRMGKLTAQQLLGVGHDAPAALIKKAYFAASKELHPDRYYGKDIGRFRDLLEQTFRRCAEAFNELNEPYRKRKPSGVLPPPKG